MTQKMSDYRGVLLQDLVTCIDGAVRQNRCHVSMHVDAGNLLTCICQMLVISKH